MRLIDATFQLEQPTQIAVDESKYSVGIKIPKVDHTTMSTAEGRVIDARECAPSDDLDWNWGEQDSLANIPRKKVPTWIKALNLKDDE